MRLWKNHRNVTDYNVTENKTYLQKIKHKTLDLLLLRVSYFTYLKTQNRQRYLKQKYQRLIKA